MPHHFSLLFIKYVVCTSMYVHFQKTRFNEIFPSRLKNETLIWSKNQLTRDAHKCKNWGRHCRKNGRWPRIMYRSTTTAAASPVESLNEAIQILFAQRGWGRYQRGHWTLKLLHFTFGVHIRLTKEGNTRMYTTVRNPQTSNVTQTWGGSTVDLYSIKYRLTDSGRFLESLIFGCFCCCVPRLRRKPPSSRAPLWANSEQKYVRKRKNVICNHTFRLLWSISRFLDIDT